MTPVTIITGYLGSGKTTLLRHMLSSTDKKLAIVMNEFGSVDIDAKIIRGRNVDIAELKGGCVCCSISGEFELAVKEIIAKVKPEHIVVETTGVVDPESLIYDVLENMPFLKLDSVVCIVDCDALARYPEIGQTARIQIEMADILLLNKTDLVTTQQLEEIEKRIRSINQKALTHKAVRCSIPAYLLFGAYTEKDVSKHAHELADIESFVFETDRPISKDRFEDFISSLQGVFRAKGFVNFPDGTYLFNYVNGRVDFEAWPREETKIVFIGNGLKKVRASCKRLFGQPF